MNSHTKNIKIYGPALGEASKVMVMAHGRGATAEDIVESLLPHLLLEGFTILAPQATNYTWYPYGFMAPRAQNEPQLSSALRIFKEIYDEIIEAGVISKNIYWLGFSQGACLTAEFLALYPTQFGGAFILSGGLIGDKLQKENYVGDFSSTPIFIGCSNVDSHIPLNRVQESSEVMRKMGGLVIEKIYPNMGHTISKDEIEEINKILSGHNGF